MQPVRRRLVTSLGAALAASLSPALRAQSGGYTSLRAPLPVEAPDKIEIAEFFAYTCIHCYNLEPLLEEWIPKLPADTRFRRVPAVFSARWAYPASIFYTFESMGLVEKLHRPFFEAIHKDRVKVDQPEALNEWLTKHGVDTRKFDFTLKSFSTQSKVQRAAQLTAAAQIDGTPAMMVHGRYVVGGEEGLKGMLQNAERLIPVVRKSLPAGK